MLNSEKQSLFRFLAIYLSSTFLLFLLATFIFYNFQRHHIVDSQNAELTQEANRISQNLRELSEDFSTTLTYPHNAAFDSALYNLDKEYIFGSFQAQNILWDKKYYQKDKTLFHIHPIFPYYLGASHLIVSKEINEEPINQLLKTSFLFLLIVGIFFSLLGLFLGKLFTAPMKESIETMNRFIEDTTHEFNTPISTILANIELIETLYDCEDKKELKRIENASKTLSRLYEDLTYLKLNHNYHRNVETLDIASLLELRIENFKTLIEAKHLSLTVNIEKETFLDIDKNDAIRMMDNLLSNAIKYNKKEGQLLIHLDSKKLKIYDTGVGIKKEDMNLIHTRFKRANKSEGGFGIGLDIVGQVVQRYNFTFNIKSIYNQHTEVSIIW
ncbi:MAG TPA: HAMP domain-containing histidine kinase [Campylobacterales bacterium]|nr:HAMP domain-containing histidine kinase [Campylobacterales bacterium]